MFLIEYTEVCKVCEISFFGIEETVSCHERRITQRREYINDKINIEVLNDRRSASLWIIKFVDNANISVTFSKYYSSICLFLVWKFSYEFNTDPNFAIVVLYVKLLNKNIYLSLLKFNVWIIDLIMKMVKKIK